MVFCCAEAGKRLETSLVENTECEKWVPDAKHLQRAGFPKYSLKSDRVSTVQWFSSWGIDLHKSDLSEQYERFGIFPHTFTSVGCGDASLHSHQWAGRKSWVTNKIAHPGEYPYRYLYRRLAFNRDLYGWYLHRSLQAYPDKHYYLILQNLIDKHHLVLSHIQKFVWRWRI